MRNIRFRTVKSSSVIVVAMALKLMGQNSMFSPAIVQTAHQSKQQALPNYLVYHHFLAWAAATDRQEKKNGATDANAFAKLLVGKPAFTDDQLSFIRKHAYDLENDLGAIDLERQQIVHQYRVKDSADRNYDCWSSSELPL